MKRLIIFLSLFLFLIPLSGQSLMTSIVADQKVAANPYGPELITNGSFTTDTNWDKLNGTTISGGEAILNSSTAYSNHLRQISIGIQNQHTYKVDLDITNYISGEIKVGLGDLTNGVYSILITANGSYSFELYLNDVLAPFDIIIFSFDVGPILHIDNVSVKEKY